MLLQAVALTLNNLVDFNRPERSSNMARLVKTAALQPLDIILCTPVGAGFMAQAMGGQFSHAALLVAKTVRFESAVEGITFEPWSIDDCRYSEGKRILLQGTSNYAKFAVYRHPDLLKVDSDTLRKHQNRMLGLAGQFNFKEYPPIERFDGILERLSEEDRRIGRRLLARVLRDHGRIVPGPFCSALVYRLFEEIGLPISAPVSDPDVVTPNDLAESNLQVVPDLHPSDEELALPQDRDGKDLADQIPSRAQYPSEVVYAMGLLQGMTVVQRLFEGMIEELGPDAHGKILNEAIDAQVEAVRRIQNSDRKLIEWIARAESELLPPIENGERIENLERSSAELMAQAPVYSKADATASLKPIVDFLVHHGSYEQLANNPAVQARLKDQNSSE